MRDPSGEICGSAIQANLKRSISVIVRFCEPDDEEGSVNAQIKISAKPRQKRRWALLIIMLLVEFWKVSDDTAQDLYHKRGDYFHRRNAAGNRKFFAFAPTKSSTPCLCERLQKSDFKDDNR